MRRLLQAVATDIRFIRSHTLQPRWYKVLKVFLLLGFILGYGALFGLERAATFLVVFALLSLTVHFVYRTMTKAWTRSWLDFVVLEEGGVAAPRRIGLLYYSAVVLNVAISVAVSQLLP